GRRNQAIEQANQRGFATARQAHDAENFAPMHLHVGVGYADHATILFQYFLFRQTLLAHRGHRRRRPAAEYLPDALTVNQYVCGVNIGLGHNFPVTPAGAGCLALWLYRPSTAANRQDGGRITTLIVFHILPALDPVR